MPKLSDELIVHMKTLPVIDAHSHLPAEEEGLKLAPDLFGRILAQYSPTTMLSAGLKVDREWLKDGSVPLEERWEKIRPYLEYARESGYMRAALFAARELYGIDGIDERSYAELSRRIAAFSGPGYYDRVLRQHCGVRAVINQGSWCDNQFAFTVYRGFMGLERGGLGCVRAAYETLKSEGGAASLEDFAQGWFARCLRPGLVGVKFCSDFLPDPPDRQAAEAAFGEIRDAGLPPMRARALCVWLLDWILRECGKRGLTVAVHCGINWTVGEDFYAHHPKHSFMMALRHPDTKFDLYHAAIPWVREAAVIANQCPNVFLNMVWAYQIAPHMMTNALNEWLDLVPANKIIGFGGDAIPVEKTAGALCLARECIAGALAQRMQERDGPTMSRAAELCRMFLFENPKRIYNLPV